MKTKEVDRLYKDLQQKKLELGNAFDELDRRIHHLKTLNDISRSLFGTVEIESILSQFLMMVIGNFGVVEGFVTMVETVSGKITHFKSMGYDPADYDLLQRGALQLVIQNGGVAHIDNDSFVLNPDIFAPHPLTALPFRVTTDCSGFLGLGSTLLGTPFSDDDRELIVTLTNSLVVALNNALSFEDIKQLNSDLQAKNDELKAALRKIEILEGIKANLTKFVPTAVSKLVENSTTSEIQEAQEREISVLFLDIEGYSKITDEIGATEVNSLVERYFSVFLDAIFENQGDIVETAGDGLMVLFLSDDRQQNALQAARTAAMIREKARQINNRSGINEQQCLVNVGVCSGKAFVGAAKFESITGSRWAYTTHGNTVNIAARLCSQAKGGDVYLSYRTVHMVKSFFDLESRGPMSLKNIPGTIEVFSLK